ncbi:MAG TPA: VOC family protein [Candidatus Dormibacteraeota bacterium]|nr:VOC family protein [Candidatus Dormibacteraeota bacterium]
MTIKEIAFTAYPAKDVARVRDFYRDVLGLPFSGEFAESGVLKYDEVKLGGGYFAVLTEEWAGRPAGSAGSVVFEVDDIESARNDLIARGLSVEEIYDTPVCRITSFSDPEGNKVSLHQRTAP